MFFSRFDSLESRVMFAFGDLDQSWDADGILRLDQYGGFDSLEDMTLQSNGRLVVALHSASPTDDLKEQIFMKRRLADGSLDKSFGKSGEAKLFSAIPSDHLYRLVALGDDSLVAITGFDGSESYWTGLRRFTASGAATTVPGFTPPDYVWNVSVLPYGDPVLAGDENGDPSVDGNIVTRWNRTAQTTSSFKLDYGEAFALSDGTILIRKGNDLYRRTGDLASPIKWGNKDFITLPGDVNLSYRNDAVLQGGNILVTSVVGDGMKIVRINASTGAIDTTFGAGSPQASNGIVTIPGVLGGVKLLDDGSMIYGITGAVENNSNRILIGHLTKDGKPDTAFNNSLGGYAHAYNLPPGEGMWELKRILVGKNGQVYVGFNGYKTNDDGYVMKINMQTTAPTTGKITGVLFNDSNKNKVKESSESLNVAKTVFIDSNSNGKLDTGERSTLTDSAGRYTFDGLVAGVYKVRRVLPSGYAVTNPVFATGSLTLYAGQTLTADIGSYYA